MLRLSTCVVSLYQYILSNITYIVLNNHQMEETNELDPFHDQSCSPIIICPEDIRVPGHPR